MIELVVRTSLLLAFAWVVTRLLTRATAATRHLVWHCTIVAVLAAPLASAIVPKIPILPKVPGLHQTLTISQRAGAVSHPRTPTVSTVAPLSAGTIDARTFGKLRTADVLGILWLLGSLTTLFAVGSTHRAARRLVGRSRPANDATQHTLDRLASDLGLRRRVSVRMLDSPQGPFITGILVPSIVLPTAADSWNPARLRSVLLHELAHVRRRDCAVQTLAQIACAAYWFNPLVWIAARRLRIERERACDDEVLARGAQPSAYANDLLEIASKVDSGFATPAVLAVGSKTEFEHRIVAILAHGRVRVPREISRWATSLLMAASTSGLLAAHSAADVPKAPATVKPAETMSARNLATEQDRERATLLLALDSSPSAIPALIAALADHDSQVREKAALGLGWRSDERVIIPLTAALRDEDSQVREKAAIALGSSGYPQAAAALEIALSDSDSEVREKAAAGLVMLKTSGSSDNPDAIRRLLRSTVESLLKLTQ
jgi:beta-lactamase regulating signal transducer with metallopeptidase domain